MHLFAILFLPLALSSLTPSSLFSPSTSTTSTCPFSTPLATLEYTPFPVTEHEALRIRQAVTTTSSGSCPAGYFGCSNLGVPQACCSNTAICTTDVVNHVACCASGASCTGVIGGAAGSTQTAQTTQTTQANGGTTVSSGGNTAGTVVSTNGIIVTAGSPPASSRASTVRGDGVVRWIPWVVGIVCFAVAAL